MKSKQVEHVAIIMDGNGRWAQERGQGRIYGHMNGVESVRSAVEFSVETKIKFLTLYAFSTENWGRPDVEVNALMELFCECVVSEVDMLIENGVKVRMIGDVDGMPPKVQEYLKQIEQKTENCSAMTLILALNYSSRDEIKRAVQKIAAKIESGVIAPQEITMEMIDENLDTADFPDPDLIIRTSGECRLSNFMMWQGAYSELYFTPTLWPDFDKKSFQIAVDEFYTRDRRFGLVNK